MNVRQDFGIPRTNVITVFRSESVDSFVSKQETETFRSGFFKDLRGSVGGKPSTIWKGKKQTHDRAADASVESLIRIRL